jgi:hypothetical protein
MNERYIGWEKLPMPSLMPPPQLLCDDQKAAYEALFAFDTAVLGLEAALR